MKKKLMIQCVSAVNRGDVSREQIGGVEHIVVSSYTLPDNVVMNDIMYPAEEIEKGYKSLERTLAPVEHPVNANGDFISASDPEAIHNFHAGAFNVNVTRKAGRVHIEKHINVQEALKTDRGKRLLDRINELETSEKPRNIHTSVGLFLTVEELEKPMTNAAGSKYSMVGHDFVFDHDAILLDSVGAATPGQGVGMAVNSAGDKVGVDRVIYGQPKHNMDSDATARLERLIETNAIGMSLNQLMDGLYKQLAWVVASDWLCIVDVYQDEVIFETGAGFFSVPYTISGDNITLSGIPIRVDKRVEYQPKTNKKGVELMKKLILNALAEAGLFSTDGLSDEQLLAEYDKLNANAAEVPEDKPDDKPDDKPEALDTITNAVKQLETKVDAMSAIVNSAGDQERAGLVSKVVNSKKYPGIDEAAAKVLPIETLKEMAANCETAHGVPFNTNSDDDAFKAPASMPE